MKSRTPGHVEVTKGLNPTRNRIPYVIEINNNRKILKSLKLKINEFKKI